MEILFLSLKFFVIPALSLFFGIVIVSFICLLLKVKKEKISIPKLLQNKYFKAKFALIKIKNDNKITSYFCKTKRGQKIVPLSQSRVGGIFSQRPQDGEIDGGSKTLPLTPAGGGTRPSPLPRRGWGRVGDECAIQSRLKINFKILSNEIYLKILYILIILFNKPKQSFEILKEDLEKKHGKEIFIKVKNQKISLNELNEKLKDNKLENKNQIIQKLIEKLFELHKQKQKKIKIASSAMMAAAVVATVITSLITTTMFPNVFQTKAATYTFVQTDWSGGQTANNANHSSHQTGWNEYSAAANIDSSTVGEIKLDILEESWTQTSDTDFNSGTLGLSAVEGTGDGASLILDP